MDQTLETLSQYAANFQADNLPPEIVHQVKRTLVDTFACAVGGLDADISQIARNLAANVSSKTSSRIFFTNDTTTPEMAAFANGCMIRYLDFNDSYFHPGGGHPSDLIAGVFAVAEQTAATGKNIIAAIALAYEVFCRLSETVAVGQKGFDEGLFGAAAAACSAGWLMGISQAQMANAISLALVPNVPLGVTRQGELSMWKGAATACATRAGIFAALLAQLNMTGPALPFVGDRGLNQLLGTQIVLGELGGIDGAAFRIATTDFKYYPAQIYTQGPIGLAIEINSEVPVTSIESVDVSTFHAAVRFSDPSKWDPQDRETADHSIPFLVATALRDGAVTLASFTQDKIDDPTLRPLMNKIQITEDKAYTKAYPQEWGCTLTVNTTDGQSIVKSVTKPKGKSDNPMSDQELDAKFESLATAVLSASQCTVVLQSIGAIDAAPNANGLLDALVG